MDISVVRRDLDHIRNQVASIENTLHKGNGRESIMTRIYSVENHLGGIQRTLSEQGRLENQRRWQLWMAVVVAALSAAGNWIPKVI